MDCRGRSDSMIPVMMRFFSPHTVGVSDFVEDFEDVVGITVYTAGGGGTAGRTTAYSGGSYELYVAPASNGYPTTARLNDYQLTSADFDISWSQSQCSDLVDSVNSVWSGLVARTSNWQNPSGIGSYNWGWCVYLHRDGTIVLGRSTDSSTSGGITNIDSKASGIGNYPGNAGNPNVRTIVDIRWRAVGDSHKVWVNDVLKIDITDSTFSTNAGYIACFTSPIAWTGLGTGYGYQALFDNISITEL